MRVTTEIRISEVEIISTFTSASASARKKVALTPGLDLMPAPTSDSLATSSSLARLANRILSWESSSACIARPRSPLGQVNVTSVKWVLASLTFCTMRSIFTPALASA